MSQQQPPPRRPQEPIKYGDVFSVEGELAGKPVAQQDAVMMQTAENSMLGNTLKGCAASIMQSAAAQNEMAGFVGHDDVTDAISGSGVTITESHVPGHRIITESYSKPAPLMQSTEQQSTIEQGQDGSGGGITIGEALEATTLTAGQKPVEWSDAAAVQAAEVRATGRTTIAPGGVAAAAQSAATLNARTTRNEDKTKLANVLSNATEKLPSDKSATRRDAEGVSGAEMRNDRFLTTHPAGVAASVAAAARLNESDK
ncbi:late embryogenesis abundant protein D-34 isoform X2 [Tripterygium wilfordii]|uniref:late embryogenesis abundant protein D-34 isoform X2 n=1 Tax=Tripterygium wilfordii TaxID=458696 RepID=UPI0018F826C3|nr:late embryogenesis abundant protein D-34 isoform X2 [Tripterygium wilfordii]